MPMKRILLFILFNSIFFSLAQAQETATEDPFADYSYLWEDSKKKKKDKKKKTEKTEPVAQTSPAQTDTIPRTEEPNTVVSDSTQQVDNIQPADTVDLPQQTVATDSLDKINQAEQARLDSLQQIEREEKRAERKEKVDKKGKTQDFRAGLPPLNAGSSLNGGFTFTVIDGNMYAGLTLAPEISIGKVGVGLDVPILYGFEEQKFRTEIFEDGVGIARLVRYVRYGQQKVDPVYVRVGTLDRAMIGFGGLVNNYTNSVSFEKRKVGVHYDFNYKGFGGIEGLYSDFDPSSFNMFVIRPYVRPLSWTPIPIVRSLEIGFTHLTDKDQTVQVEGASKYVYTKDGINASSFDAGMTLLRVPFIQIDLFANFTQLKVKSDSLANDINTLSALDTTAIQSNFKNGRGASVGVNFRFHFIADILSTDVRIERLSYSDFYLPQFFDASYEINKDAKLLSLAYAGKTQGIYGSLTGHILQKVSLGGSLMIPDEVSETAPAIVTLHAEAERLLDKYSIYANYYKGGLSDLGDAFVLDDRSLAKVRFAYHMNKFLNVGVDYYYTFVQTEDGYEPATYVSPFFGLSIDF